MPVLNSTQRSLLEKAVIKARRLSVRGAFNSLKAFAVDHKEPYSHMSAEERELRNKLRSKARLLGDNTTVDGGHTIDKLAYELAYEFWHQMLFAKFLEANGLLIHPEHEIAVSLEECEELGPEEGFEDKWEAAASYASKMLPAIFRYDDPLMQLKFATEDRLALEKLIESISEEVFQADDSLGWVYQYWQTEEKERINAEGNPIDGDSISAVTQLFTEPYMVHFLIDNTLGAWWTARNPGVISPYHFNYLRTLEDGTPAAGSFAGWPETLREITMLDPCMGSGHFLVDVFIAMATLRMHDEGLSKAEACDAVIIENIHGLELDARCTQIAAFNLALTAWRFCGKYRILPEMNLACSGIAPKGKKEDWIKLANSERDAEKRTRLKGGLERMYDLFQQAPELGSLIDPTTIERDAFTSDFEELQPFLEEALKTENAEKENERVVIAAGVAKAGALLAKRYVLQITNVPYLKRHKQSNIITDYVDRNYATAKGDLATVFIAKMRDKALKGGVLSIVSPHGWMFLGAYKEFRKNLIQKDRINLTALLGTGAFETISGEIVNVDLTIIEVNGYLKPSIISFNDVSVFSNLSEKIKQLNISKLFRIDQSFQLKNPDYRILPEQINEEFKIMDVNVTALAGYAAGDSVRFEREITEVALLSTDWEFLQGTVTSNKFYSGRSTIVLWQQERGDIYKLAESVKSINHIAQNWLRGKPSWGKKGVVVSQMGGLAATLYGGNIYNCNCCALIPKNLSDLSALWCYAESNELQAEVKKIDQSIKVTPKTFLKIPFDLNRWQKVAEEKYPNGLPKPYSDDPTQWLFHGNPMYTEFPLQVVIARLMGYEWPAENDDEMELSDEAKGKIKANKEFDLPFDKDGIVCIPAVNGESSAADRIRENIITIWGDNYDGSTLSSLMEQEGSNKRDLESYLREDYFGQHCKLFNNKPFIWHIWDGRKDGFAALVNYHKLDRATLEKVIYTYLGDWINQCELKMQNNVGGADGLLSAAKALKEKLILILEGEPPYDLFIRWKSLEEQPFGWNPDINDGIRLNVYPFVEAGVLRKKFNVKWGKDRGKNPSGSYWGPDRWNRYEDLDDKYKLKDEQKNVIPHLTNEVKRKARK